jgi:hypothetical protein
MLIQLDHSAIVRATQQAMAAQLYRDGRLPPNAEIGLTFLAPSPEQVGVIGRVRSGRRVVHELRGGRSHMATIATQAALPMLPRGRWHPEAKVRWRWITFSDNEGDTQRFMADVTFREATA